MAQLTSAMEAEPNQSTQLVAAYEQLSAALFDGDMEAIRQASTSLAEAADQAKATKVAKDARALGETTSVDAARKAFTSVSDGVIAAVEGESGYYIMSCPMVKNGLWLQSSKDLKNPYMGERMPKCGMLKRETGSKKRGS